MKNSVEFTLDQLGYIQDNFCVWVFSAPLFVSQVREMELGKRAILL